MKGDLNCIQESFNSSSAKYLFRTNEDKIKYEIKQFNIIKKELKEEKDNIKFRLSEIQRINKKINKRVKELRDKRKNGKK